MAEEMQKLSKVDEPVCNEAPQVGEQQGYRGSVAISRAKGQDQVMEIFPFTKMRESLKRDFLS